MKKRNFTSPRWNRLTSTWLMLVGLLVCSLQIQAQGLPCISNVNVTLDANCQAIVTADEILTGTGYNYADYDVTFTDGPRAGLPVLLGPGDVGVTYSVTVTGPTGLSCWGNILVEDKTDPVISCSDVVLSCTDALPTGPDSASDACGPVTVTFEDTAVNNGCAGAFSDIITRVYTVTDGSGNTATCTQTISIERATLAGVVFPANVTIDCQDSTDPINTGSPTGATCFNLDFTYVDQTIQICNGSYKLLREWTAADWCTETVEKQTQIIKVLDTTAPTLACPSDVTIGTTSNGCTGNFAIPVASATDDCSAPVSISASASAGTLVNNIVTDLPLGTSTVTYTATDDCGNEATCTINVTVVDNIAPIAICDEHTIVGIGSDGTALVAATTFDDGSIDNCGDITLDVRRMDNPDCPGNDATAFDTDVPFRCCDIGSIVMVELRVTDAAGNTNSCMVEVEVQDKIRPVIVCPANKTIECTDDISPAFNGTAVATDNCGTPVVTFVDISNTIDDCGVGTIRRSWTARVDNSIYGSSNCIQTITVINSDPFVITDTECRRFPLNTTEHTLLDDVEWPCDIELNTCGIGITPDALADNGTTNPITNQQVRLDARPTVTENACENVAMTHIDTQLDFGAGDACIKVLRKWIIINWCDVANNQDPTVPGPGVYHYVQVIKVLNSTAPVIETFNGATTIDNFSGSTQTNNPNDACGTAFVAFDITASDDCSAQSDLIYTWAFSTGTSGTGTSASGAFANGSYSVTFSVSDQCGNTSTETRDFTVRDAKKPTPVCIFGLASTVMPSAGQVTIWASDFESGSSFDNCTPYGQLEFSFSQDITDKDIVITCADIPASGLVPVTLYVTDAAGNFDFCSTFISVTDPNGSCGQPTAVIGGTIENENQEVVDEVIVTLSDDAGMNMPVTTNADGTYQFGGMTYGDYNVTPEKNINYLNGVTTYDLVKISKHILGTETLDSPYKIIAADANHSETVTTLDIVKLRALILHIDDELANNNSWRFVDANFTFADATNPFAATFPEFVDLDGTVAVPVNFTAIKVGDVNGTAIANNLLGSETRTFNGDLALQIATTEVAAGETFTVDFNAKDFNNIAGYQFSLGFNNSAVEFVDVVTNLEGLTASNFGLTKLNEGVITTSWNTANAVSMNDDATLFSLTFVANEAISTNELFEINSRYTASEAYSGSDLYNVSLAFNGNVASDKFELYQNTPNPFKAETAIGFNLTEAGTVTLKLYDVSGRVLRLMEVEAVKGFNSVNLNRADFDATGVLYYQLETATATATKKMILVD